MKRTDVRVMVDDGKAHTPHRLDPLIAELAKALRALVRERKCDRIAESRVGFRHTAAAIEGMRQSKRLRDARRARPADKEYVHGDGQGEETNVGSRP